MTREELRRIGSLGELESARRVIGKSLRLRRKALETDLHRVRNMFRPVSLLGAGWALLAPSARPLESILLGWVRSLKHFVLKLP